MKSISHSQFTAYNECNLKWKLRYIDKLSLSGGNIHTLFGSAMHTVLQEYLVTMYNKSIVEADKLDLETMLKEEMIKEFNTIKKRFNAYPCEQKDLMEFYQDGIEIIKHFRKHRNKYFMKKNYELVGIEVPIEYELPNNIKFIGYMDVVLHDTLRDRYKIIDIKTSTMGWNKYQKADKNKTDQLLLYKYFFSKEQEVPIDSVDVEYFIVKRKLYENLDFPQRRVQTFSPASGKPSINKVVNNLQRFIDESFEDGKHNLERDYLKLPSKKNCKYCEFNQTEHCDAGVK